MSDDYYERIQARRAEERAYESDAAYEVWRSGGDMDRIDPDRVSEHFNNGDDFFAAARDELRHQRPAPREEEQYPDEQFPQEEMP